MLIFLVLLFFFCGSEATNVTENLSENNNGPCVSLQLSDQKLGNKLHRIFSKKVESFRHWTLLDTEFCLHRRYLELCFELYDVAFKSKSDYYDLNLQVKTDPYGKGKILYIQLEIPQDISFTGKIYNDMLEYKARYIGHKSGVTFSGHGSLEDPTLFLFDVSNLYYPNSSDRVNPLPPAFADREDLIELFQRLLQDQFDEFFQTVVRDIVKEECPVTFTVTEH